ncbi:MAG TPA: diiron oxygenase [Glycomyces sp.]|nr:diiron oxygenase [Glycomyces sp.]
MSIWSAWDCEDGIGESTLRRIALNWPRRASVRAGFTEAAPEYRPEIEDYPRHLVPFAEHPRFLAAEPRQRSRVLTGLWLGYNERVIETERLIAEPAFDLIMRGTFPGSRDPLVRQSVQQSLIDESFHSYMHMFAIERTMQLRRVRERPGQPTLVTYRRLRQTLDGMPEPWQRDIAVLIWGAVAETCINALLALIARDDGVQPMHSLITTLHLRDESAHGSVVVEVVKRLYDRMNAEQRATVEHCLPLALRAFTEQDLSALRVELEHARIEGVDEILADVRRMPANRELVRDYSGAKRLVRELGLTERVEFDFPDSPEWATAFDVERRVATILPTAGEPR